MTVYFHSPYRLKILMEKEKKQKQRISINIFLEEDEYFKNYVNEIIHTATEICRLYAFLNHLLADNVHSS